MTNAEFGAPVGRLDGEAKRNPATIALDALPCRAFNSEKSRIRMPKLLLCASAALVLALCQSGASAALKFGQEEKIRFVANTTLEGPAGERLYLARKITLKSFLLPYTIEDNGFVFGVSGDSRRYFHLPQGARLGELQRAGHLPNPLPTYELDPLDLLFGRSLWLALIGFAAYGGYKLLSRKAAVGSTPAAADRQTGA